MDSVEGSLTSDEQEVQRSKLQWIVFVGSAVFSIPGFLFLAGPKEIAPFGLFFLGIAWIWAFFALAFFKTSEFVVTNKRVTIKVGVIQRQSLEILLKQIESIAVHQGIFGRIFGYSFITVVGTGGTKKLFTESKHRCSFAEKSRNKSLYKTLCQRETQVAPGKLTRLLSAPERKDVGPTPLGMDRLCLFC